MKKKAKLQRWGIGEYIRFIILVILAILIIYPMFWIIMSSFKDYNGIFKDVWGLPKEWLFENYKLAWEKGISKSPTTSSTGGLILALQRAILLLAPQGGVTSTFTGPL